MVIWANHNLRASISAMQAVSKRIRDQESLINIEHEVRFIFFWHYENMSLMIGLS